MRMISTALSAVCLIVMSLPAQSLDLRDTIVSGQLNIFEDQGRQSIFDVDVDGRFSQGDVMIGYIRIDDRAVPHSPHVSIRDDLYLVYSVQVRNVRTTSFMTQTAHEIGFESTTVAGLTLADLGVTNTADGSLFAVYGNVGADLMTGSPGDLDNDGRLTILDFITRITDATLDLVVGLELLSGSNQDHLRSVVFVMDTLDPVANLSLLEAATLMSGLPGGSMSFHGGLGITYSAAAVGYHEDCAKWIQRRYSFEPCWARRVEDSVEYRSRPTLHEFAILNGDASGASDLYFGDEGNPYFSSGSGGQLLGYNFYGLSSNADLGVYPSAPTIARLPYPRLRDPYWLTPYGCPFGWQCYRKDPPNPYAHRRTAPGMPYWHDRRARWHTSPLHRY